MWALVAAQATLRFSKVSRAGWPFEEGEGGRFTETMATGEVFEIGRIGLGARGRVPGARPPRAGPDAGGIHFEALEEETHVTVEHHGWDSIAACSASSNSIFMRRHAEWWQVLLNAYGTPDILVSA